MYENENIIDFENVYVNYDLMSAVLKNITLEIKQGEHWAILGSNGSGKSTLIKLFSNDLYPNTKYKFKKNIFGKNRSSVFELKKNLGIITSDLHNYFQTHGNFLSAYEVILSGYYSSVGVFKHQNFTKKQHTKALEVLESLEISHIKDKKVYQMSTGQLRRCIIGRALIHEPKAFILDEPTVGLDIKAQNSFISLIRKLSSSISIIIVTHYIEEIFPEISHLALIYKQTIYKQGFKRDILNSGNLSEIFEANIKIGNKNGRYFIEEVN